MGKMFILLIFLIKYLNCNIITIPFKKYISPDINETNFYSFYANSYLYSTINIGNLNQEIKVQLKTNQYSLCIRNDSNIYDYNSSSSYKKNSDEISPPYTGDYLRAIPSNETFIFGNERIKGENIKFMLTKNSKFDSEGVLGLKIYENSDKTKGHGLISQLKGKKLINKEAFFFNFDKDGNGELIIGDYPHLIEKFQDQYQEIQFKQTSLHITNYEINFDMKFRSISWNGTIIEKESISHIILESGYIIGSQPFEDKSYDDFFYPHFIAHKCTRKIVNVRYYAYICDDYPDLDITKFPEINFYISDIEYNLKLTYEDMFIKKDGKIYFMIVFDKNGGFFWTLGDMFIKRNKLVFDMNRRILGIYDQNVEPENNTDNKKLIYIIVICIASLIIIGLIIFILYKFVWKKRNKKKYELNDDYEYNTAINP